MPSGNRRAAKLLEPPRLTSLLSAHVRQAHCVEPAHPAQARSGISRPGRAIGVLRRRDRRRANHPDTGASRIVRGCPAQAGRARHHRLRRRRRGLLGSAPVLTAAAPRVRAVFDTNVVISAPVFRRRFAWLRQAWASGTVIPVVCRETVAELLRVLTYPKFRLDAMERETLLADYLPFAEITTLPQPPPNLSAACRDRDDAVFLQLAIASSANVLVCGDADLTVLAGDYSIASPETLRQLLGREA